MGFMKPPHRPRLERMKRRYRQTLSRGDLGVCLFAEVRAGNRDIVVTGMWEGEHN